MADENLVKIEDVAKALGVEFAPDEDANTFVSKVVTKQRELILNDSSVIQPIKENAIKEAEIVALKKSKKAIATTFGLGYSNSELSDKTIEDLLAEGSEALRKPGADKTPDEIKELQNKLMAISSEYEEVKTNHIKEIETIHQKYQREKAESYFEKELINKLTEENKKYHVPVPKIVELIKLQVKNELSPILEDGKLKFVDANGNQKLNDSKTGLFSIDDIAKLASDLEIKSNGRGERHEVEYDDKILTDKMKANRARMAQTYS